MYSLEQHLAIHLTRWFKLKGDEVIQWINHYSVCSVVSDFGIPGFWVSCSGF